MGIKGADAVSDVMSQHSDCPGFSVKEHQCNNVFKYRYTVYVYVCAKTNYYYWMHQWYLVKDGLSLF